MTVKLTQGKITGNKYMLCLIASALFDAAHWDRVNGFWKSAEDRASDAKAIYNALRDANYFEKAVALADQA